MWKMKKKREIQSQLLKFVSDFLKRKDKFVQKELCLFCRKHCIQTSFFNSFTNELKKNNLMGEK